MHGADCFKGSVKLHVQRNLKSVVEPIKATITFCFDAQNKPTLDSVRTAGFFLSLSISLWLLPTTQPLVSPYLAYGTASSSVNTRTCKKQHRDLFYDSVISLPWEMLRIISMSLLQWSCQLCFLPYFLRKALHSSSRISLSFSRTSLIALAQSLGFSEFTTECEEELANFKF